MKKSDCLYQNFQNLKALYKKYQAMNVYQFEILIAYEDLKNCIVSVSDFCKCENTIACFGKYFNSFFSIHLNYCLVLIWYVLWV